MTTSATKAVWLLRGARHDELLDPGWRPAVAAAGARRVQLNLDDEHVADALRIPTAEPIDAVVSIWLDDADTRTAHEAVAATARTADGYLVEERRPLDPPESWDGARVEALANVAVLRRPGGLDAGEWRHRWLVDHTPVAIETQATFGYVQNLVTGPAAGDPPPVAGIVEELFVPAALTDIHAFYGSDGDDAVLADRMTRLMASVARFGADRDLDLVPTSRYLLGL